MRIPPGMDDPDGLIREFVVYVGNTVRLWKAKRLESTYFRGNMHGALNSLRWLVDISYPSRTAYAERKYKQACRLIVKYMR